MLSNGNTGTETDSLVSSTLSDVSDLRLDTIPTSELIEQRIA